MASKAEYKYARLFIGHLIIEYLNPACIIVFII